MEKRIKIVYLLTAITSIVLIAVQVYWLYSQYMYSLQQLENELFTKTLTVAETDRQLRAGQQNKQIHAIIRSETSIALSSDSLSGSEIGWNFETYIIHDTAATGLPLPVRYDSLYLDSFCRSRNDVRKYRFAVDAHNGKQDVYDALDRFLVNERCPFTVEHFDSLLAANGLAPDLIQIETTDSIVWHPGKTRPATFSRPALEVTYPFNILQKQQVSVLYRLNILSVFGNMLLSLLTSLVLSSLLIFSMIYQIKTIFRQQRIDELRKSFVHTMIHELKRPITTLKMCLSFMNNEKMMQDADMKQDILRSSHNELDNLSSYFSKLRDVMVDDLKDIPLNLSTFNLRELAGRCIEKQTLPANRNIHIQIIFEDDRFEITADKIHIENILCNLLENALKYSEGDTEVRIECHSAGDSYLLQVSDNGMGISEAERRYVFDKFFRATNVAGKNISGIGLGLYYVKLLVLAHHGNISLHSILGKGSRFTIEIPKKQ
jgi:two-component system phosphate regulon sensor histidine kinase PhoR